MNIGIVGNGFVGGAVANGMSNASVKVYDRDINRSTHKYDEVVHCDFVFVCLIINGFVLMKSQLIIVC